MRRGKDAIIVTIILVPTPDTVLLEVDPISDLLRSEAVRIRDCIFDMVVFIRARVRSTPRRVVRLGIRLIRALVAFIRGKRRDDAWRNEPLGKLRY